MTTLSLADVCKLHYDLHEKSASEQKVTTTITHKKQQASSLSSLLKVIIVDDHHHGNILFNEEEQLNPEGQSSSGKFSLNEYNTETTSPFENSIDPIEYLKSGELVLFPSSRVSNNEKHLEFKMILSMRELLEYYRHFPSFHWSKYPQLLELIRDHLLLHEKRALERMEGEYIEYQKQQFEFMRKYHRFVSRFSLTEWLSDLFRIHVLGLKKKEHSTLREDLQTPPMSSDNKHRIMKSFRHLLPYVSLMALFWIFKLLTKLVSWKR
ncbi:hypothetical protein FDP41_004068 [Naegleria fowleri]|uniref:Uncharacterized protein n=1 Tax=Naegleria fowleri TaxID=5763 RepID=A0A6A5BG02_NAEFO|nr:uncharacterized protein FDP41_004068 [Naegleria fowleri]KAF0976773.1 hypothetical protein FDP41_004068 [Naegleria fowleri]